MASISVIHKKSVDAKSINLIDVATLLAIYSAQVLVRVRNVQLVLQRYECSIVD